MARVRQWRTRVSLTEDELEVIASALAIWQAGDSGGDVSEEEREDYSDACDSALVKINNAMPK